MSFPECYIDTNSYRPNWIKPILPSDVPYRTSSPDTPKMDLILVSIISTCVMQNHLTASNYKNLLTPEHCALMICEPTKSQKQQQ